MYGKVSLFFKNKHIWTRGNIEFSFLQCVIKYCKTGACVKNSCLRLFKLFTQFSRTIWHNLSVCLERCLKNPHLASTLANTMVGLFLFIFFQFLVCVCVLSSYYNFFPYGTMLPLPLSIVN